MAPRPTELARARKPATRRPIAAVVPAAARLVSRLLTAHRNRIEATDTILEPGGEMISNGWVRTVFAAVAAGGLAACSGGEGPASVAERFWTAARDRDEATLRATSIESESASLKLDGNAGVGEVAVGAAEVDGDEAAVETRLTAETEEQSIDLSFETVLVRRDGAWLVDLDETSSRMMQSLFGASMQELGEAMAEGMAEGMKDAMQEMAEGMAEGMKDAMQEMAEGMAEALQDVEESPRSGSDSDPPERD